MNREPARRLAFGPPLVFDGGMASELEKRGFDLSGGLWSARALRDAPDLIRSIHEDYLCAGADVITTASYQASFTGFAAEGIDADEAEELIGRSVSLAREAIASSGGERPRLVAGSCGPFGAVMGGGREYDGAYGAVDWAAIEEFHRRRIEVLAAAAVDLLIFETLPRLDEALLVAELLAEPGHLPAIMSFQLATFDRLAGGDRLDEVIQHLNAIPEVIAIGINCCAPSRASAGLHLARAHSLKPLALQANSGEGFDGKSWTAAPAGEDLLLEARDWLRSGARAIGGCCRTGPETTAGLRLMVGS